MDLIIILLVVGVAVMLLRGAFQTNSEPEYVIVPVQHSRERLGCLPFIVGIIVGVLLLILLRGS